jgi:hypothetical protein
MRVSFGGTDNFYTFILFSRQLLAIFLGFLIEEEIKVSFHKSPMLSNLDRRNLSILHQFIDCGNWDL